MEWLSAHAGDIWAIVSGVVALAAAITALTPSTKDDGIVAKIRGVLNMLALNVKNSKSD